MSAPRWKSILERSFQTTDKISAGSYSLATIDDGQSRVRTILHRGFFTPNGPSQPILATTTDIRAHKCTEILSDQNAEVVWYIRGPEEQFRISAKAYIVPHFQHPSFTLYKEKFRHLTRETFDWETERRDRFNDKSPQMRASWARPPPGSPLIRREEADKWPKDLPKLGEGSSREEDAQIEFAFSNFALLLLDPQRVDWVELGVQPNRRTVFTKQQSGNGWTEQIVVP